MAEKQVITTRNVLLLAVLSISSVTIAGEIRDQSRPAMASDSWPTFETVSVKPTRGGNPNLFRFDDPSRFSATNIHLKDLIEFAYHMRPFQVTGGPSWINSQGYDIEAKIDDLVAARLQKLSPAARMDQLRLMLRSLLKDRFKLVLAYRTKQLPIYAVVLAKRGPKLTPTTVLATHSAVTHDQSQRQGPLMMISPGRITSQGMDLSAFIEALEHQPELAGRVVVDETGIKGKYDFTLRFTPQALLPHNTAGSQVGVSAPPSPATDSPTLFTAIQEQLGLRLVSKKGSVQTLFVKNIEKPSPN